MIEIWRDIKDYEGLYQVSNLGRVKSLKRIRRNKRNSISIVKETILTPVKCKGYLFITLWNNGKYKQFKIHRLVAMTFPDLVGWTKEAKEKPFDELQVNHKDEFDKTNNCVNNLEWCTASYNVNYGTRNIRTSNAQLNDKSKSKPVLQYTLDGQFVAEYPSASEASRQTNVDASQIRRCCKGIDYNGDKALTAGGYIWKFKE